MQIGNPDTQDIRITNSNGQWEDDCHNMSFFLPVLINLQLSNYEYKHL